MRKESREFNIDFMNEKIKFTSKEGLTYARLFSIIDTSSSDVIEGKAGAIFLRRANLSNDINKEIWRLASGGKSKNGLCKESWYIAMKLVGLAQSTGRCKMQPLLSGEGMQESLLFAAAVIFY